MNAWQGIGRLGADPETVFAGQTKVVKFRMATDEIWKDKQGTTQKRTEWHRIILFGKNADTAERYLRKGRLIHVEGRIQNRTFEKSDGSKGYVSEIVVRQFKMLDSGKQAPKATEGETKAAPPGEPDLSNLPVDIEDVPF